METKKEISARISEIDTLISLFGCSISSNLLDDLETRKDALRQSLNEAGEDIFESVLRSHKILCEVKQMDEKAAYGQNPALYYAAGVAAEAGEMLNDIVKACRNGYDPEAAKAAVASELPDVIIYSAILSHVLDLDLTKLVNKKVEIVIQRAMDGYYGGPIPGLSNKPSTSELNDQLRPFEITLITREGNRVIGDIVWTKDADEAIKLGCQLYPYDQYPNADLRAVVPSSTDLNEYMKIPIEERITAETLLIKQIPSWDSSLRPYEVCQNAAGDTDVEGVVWAKNKEEAEEITERLFPDLENTDVFTTFVREAPIFRIDQYAKIPVEKRITKSTKSVKRPG